MIVAEAGINHDGDLGTALEMIQVAKDAGADAIKFQIYYEDSICEPGIEFTYLSNGYEITEDMRDMFNRCMLSHEDWKYIKAECDNAGIEFMATPMCEDSLELVVNLGVKRIKVASSDLTNIPLLKAMKESGLPVILSIGMADIKDVTRSWVIFGGEGDVTYAICTSEYPTAPEHVNLGRMAALSGLSSLPSGINHMGLSDHTIGNTAAIMAVAYGATYFEKHFTLDNTMDGPDNWFSANPGQLKSWVDSIREAKLMVGSGIIEPTVSERESRKIWRKNKGNGYVRRA
jgi:sialic acid synthase SpsE